jgi:hypothetical protein
MVRQSEFENKANENDYEISRSVPHGARHSLGRYQRAAQRLRPEGQEAWRRWRVEESSGSSSWRTVAVSSQSGMVLSINNSGQMAGFLEGPSGVVEPYAWTVGAGDAVSTTPLDFSYVPQSATGEPEWVANSGAANCVNEEGMIVGTVGERDPTGALPDLTAAVIWTSPQALAVALPLPASNSSSVFDSSEGFAISHPPSAATFPGLRAVAVGRYLWRSHGENLVVLAAWAILDDGSVQSPITLDIGITGQFESAPLAINRGLTVVGTLDESAMVWQLDWVEQAAETSEPAGGEEPLPPGFTLAITSRLELFPTGDFSRAAGINEAAVAVVPPPLTICFACRHPGAVAGSVEALHCNDSANVVGWYNDANGLRNGFFYNHAARSYTSLGAAR